MKTLKDLLKGLPLAGEDFIGMVDGHELRELAKEWIKKLEDDVSLMVEKRTPTVLVDIPLAKLSWIKKFFNLESEILRMKVKQDETLKDNEFRLEDEP